MTPEERRDRVEVLRGLRAELRSSGQDRLLCHVQMCLSVHETFRGDPATARVLLDEALSLADPDTDRDLFLSVLQMEGTYWLHVGEPARAVEACATMVRQADAHDAPASFRIKSRLNLAYGLGCLGEFAGAERFVGEARALAEASGMVRRQGEVAAVGMILQVDAGDLSAAARQYAAAVHLLDGDVDARARVLFRMTAAALAVDAGELDVAESTALELRMADHAGTSDDQLFLADLLARVSLLRGQAVSALEWSDRGRSLRTATAHGPRRAAHELLRARILHALGASEAMFESLDGAFRDPGFGAGRALWASLEARLHELHQLREVELRAKNAALQRMHRKEAKARELAEAAARSRHLFLSAMSHEMRTPLAGVMGALSLLDVTDAPDEQARLLGVARRSARLTLQIIDDILDLGRLESGRMSLDLRPFELVRPVEDVRVMMAERAEREGTRIDVHVAHGLPHWVSGDARRLKQVLINLLSNALKFASGGQVWVRLLPIPDGVRFEVEDDGIGIPRAVQSRLFEPFTQAGPTIARDFGGTGLGLAVCRAIAVAYGGRIGVDSEAGTGATFWLELPLPEAQEIDADPISEVGDLVDERRLDGLRILLAEDNAVNRQLGEMTLLAMGAEVALAEDGVEAVHSVQAHPPDLVLMDMHMPRMGGLAATRHIRAAGYAGPVVALTAAVLPEDREAALAAGMDGFATKPIDPPDLVETILAALDRRGGLP